MTSYSQSDENIKDVGIQSNLNETSQGEVEDTKISEKGFKEKFKIGLSNFIKRTFKIALNFFGIYIILIMLLIPLSAKNPLPLWLALYPFFMVQDIIGDFRATSIEIDRNEYEDSAIILPANLFEIETEAKFDRRISIDEIEDDIKIYFKQFEIGIGTYVNYYKTSKGAIVIEEGDLNNSSYRYVSIYSAENGVLHKIETLNDSKISIYEDDSNNVYIKFSSGPDYALNYHEYVGGTILKKIIHYSSDKMRICSSKDKIKCKNINLDKTSFNMDISLDSLDEINKFYLERNFPELSAEQKSCLNRIDRLMKDNSNMRLESLKSQLINQCITNTNIRPFDFDIFAYEPDIYYYATAFFQKFKNGSSIMYYNVKYDGFEIISYSKSSIAYKIFEGIVNKEYTEGQYVPIIDNNEIITHGDLYTQLIDSIIKEKINDVDVYTIKAGSSSRFKVFELDNTYVVITYDSDRSYVITEEKANEIVRHLIDNGPYIPVMYTY